MDERRKHGWPFWVAAMAILLPLFYVVSFGVFSVAVDRGVIAARPICHLYRPVLVAVHRWEPVRTVAVKYARFFGAVDPFWTMTRLEHAEKITTQTHMPYGMWPRDMLHDVPHRKGAEPLY